MKKSNWIIYALLALVSVFLLWLWFYLGFNEIDSPLDLIASIIWWLVIIVSVVIVVRVEKTRKERIRTIYVSDRTIFNSEAGIKVYRDCDQMIEFMEEVLEELSYDFTKNELPDLKEVPIHYYVKTSDFSSDTWKGEIVFPSNEEGVAFADRDELSQILHQAKTFVRT